MTSAIEFDHDFPVAPSAVAAHQEQDLRRALEAYHFFYPTVSMEAIARGTRAAGAADNKAALLVVAQPRHVGFTLNSDTPYAGGILDLRESGPVVIELPPGPLVGLADDHHQRWITDLGLAGADGGKGGRHLILPPGWHGTVPAGYLAARSDTWLVLFALRALPLGGDLDAAVKLLTSVRVYRLNGGDRNGYGYADATARPVDTTPLAWEANLGYWRVLHEVISAEPPVEEMRPMLGALAELGIEAGRPFRPAADLAQVLTIAAERGRDEMLVAAFASRRPDRMVWPGRAWEWVGLRPENGAFERAGSLDVEARDRWFAQAIVASPAMFRRTVGQGSLYWLACRDAVGGYLDGGRTYKLIVPLPVPASLFWSVTCYDAQTRSEISAEQGKAALRSLFEDIAPGDADSVDLYFGPARPDEAGDRWIQTVPGRGWFCYFRIYGPQAPAFDGSWRPGDFIARSLPDPAQTAQAGPWLGERHGGRRRRGLGTTRLAHPGQLRRVSPPAHDPVDDGPRHASQRLPNIITMPHATHTAIMRPCVNRAGGSARHLAIRRRRSMLILMARKTGVLSVVVSGAAPAADVGSLVKQAVERGWTVQVIATPSALAFFDAAEIEGLTGSPVRSQHRAPGTPRSPVPDAIVVAPATFNLLNQWALGVADSYALAVLAEQTGMGLPIVVLPAVSGPLASRPQFARSLKALRAEGVSVMLGPGGTAPPGATEDAFPWHLALDEAFSMTGFGG